jgi:hypothetical protein
MVFEHNWFIPTICSRGLIRRNEPKTKFYRTLNRFLRTFLSRGHGWPGAFLLLLTFAPILSSAEVLFEGFYRIERNKQHVGYLIQRLSTDIKSGNKVMTTYVRRLDSGSELFSAFRTEVDGKTFAPVSSRWNSTDTGVPARVESTFTKGFGRVSFHFFSSKKPTRVDPKVKAPMMSSFLFNTVDISALKPEQKYSYSAFSEQRGFTVPGKIRLEEIRTVGENKFFVVVNDYLGEPIYNFVDQNGFVLGARAFTGDFTVWWVPTREEAVGHFKFPTAEFTTLFGDLPSGKKNPWQNGMSAISAANIVSNTIRKPAQNVSPIARANPIPIPIRKFK